MLRKLLSVALIFVVTALSGCVAPSTDGGSNSQVPEASATRTLPVASPTPTVTATLMSTATSTPSLQVTLAAVGDLMLGRTVGEQILEKGPQVVFAGVQSVLDEADVRVGNLECAITDQDDSQRKTYTLQAPLAAAEALGLGKFDLVSLANNHAMDFGYAGLTDSQRALSQFGVATVGAGANRDEAHAPVILERNGLRLAFLAYVDVIPELYGFDVQDWMATESTPGVAWGDPDQIRADVTAAKGQADVVIVLLHSGFENTTPTSPDQMEDARAAIDAGAALVLGSHPHLLQTIEEYHGGLIAYSLGNFVFDNYLGISNATIILRVTLTRQGFQGYDYVPVLIENGLPVLTTIERVRGVETLVAP